jgi:hypothetical protein
MMTGGGEEDSARVSERKVPAWEKWLVGVVVAACVVGWAGLAWMQHRAKEPVAVVREHFIFYPEYRAGAWTKSACADGRAGCSDVAYTVNVGACGPVKFEWEVFADGDADTAYSYRGATPRIDEGAYALYAVVGADSRFIDSSALGKPAPASCALK